MRPRLLSLSAALLVALAACSGGGGTDDDPDDGGPTGPPPPPPTSMQYTGGWTGTTSQNKVFAMFVEDAGIALLMIGYGYNQTGCSTSIIGFSPFELPTLPSSITNGSFTITAANRIIAGTFTSSGAATGTVTVNDATCGQISATWTATKASGATVNLAATWAGSFRSSLAAQTSGTLTLQQAGNVLTGTYSVPSSGAGGTVSGTVLGQTARFTLTQTEPAGCPGIFSGHAVMVPGTGAVPDVLFFFYSGADCLGMHSLGSGSGTRRP